MKRDENVKNEEEEVRECPCDASWQHIIIRLSGNWPVLKQSLTSVLPWHCPAMHDWGGCLHNVQSPHSTSKKTEVPPFSALPHCAGSVLSIAGLRNYASTIDES